MAFLSGPITFDCFRIDGKQPRQLGQEQIEVLERYAIGQIESASTDQSTVGFLAGSHLFDGNFNLGKNVIGDALHCGMRIDTNQIPAAIRRAWMQMELAAVTADNPGRRPTKAQRQEAKAAVEARCEEEAASGRFQRMQQFPLLWDAQHGLLYFGGSSPKAGDQACDLWWRAFEVELQRLTAGRRALEWAAEAKRRKALDEVRPAQLHPNGGPAEIAWWNHESENFDFLGNEFLLWLWWRWETQSDTIALPDGSEVTGMIARTLSLQCPLGLSGKETISAEAPAALPEAAQAIRSGKLPRKAGLTLVRYGDQYDLVLQAETFTVSGAKIHTAESAEEKSEGQRVAEDRINNLRGLNETLNLLFRTFCELRAGKDWGDELKSIRRWLKGEASAARKRTG